MFFGQPSQGRAQKTKFLGALPGERDRLVLFQNGRHLLRQVIADTFRTNGNGACHQVYHQQQDADDDTDAYLQLVNKTHDGRRVYAAPHPQRPRITNGEQGQPEDLLSIVVP